MSHKIEKTAVGSVIGIILLFSTAISVTLIAPHHVDKSWTSPSSSYQVQMYEISDPNTYLSSTFTAGNELQMVYHLRQGQSLHAYQESETVSIKAPPELEKYVTRANGQLILTTRLLLLKTTPGQTTLELYDPQVEEAFSLSQTDGILEDWVDTNYTIIDPTQPFHVTDGVIFVLNPVEYKVKEIPFGTKKGWRYDPEGRSIASLQELQEPPFAFRSRKELIAKGERVFAAEGCFYCHTDQTRTLVQDVVLNGTESYPAPPSSANEYIYQWITFPGTRRIGPDLSRVGVKRPSRDWHKSHFWSPKTASPGSIMPSFRHFFDFDPSGTNPSSVGVPNYQFEAIYQYLLTKGTRITPPTEAWWLGKDPLQTKAIIEGKKKL
ncbi:MAG: cbb3-type cytochrome c oxidase subunit II [Chlamydiia bacterium]|nr:cbb3-type cytochrome c oxidase subunit II [Chlamydiia bacterium]